MLSPKLSSIVWKYILYTQCVQMSGNNVKSGFPSLKFKSLLKSRKIWAITVGSQLTIRGAVTLLVLGNSIFLKRLWLSEVLCHYYSGALVLLESYSRLRLAKAWLNTDFWLGKKLLTSFFSKVSNFVAFYVQQVQRKEINSADG